MKKTLLLALAVALVAGGCDEGKTTNAPAATPEAAAPATRPAAGPRVVFLGDSLTAGLGVDKGQAFPALLGDELEAADLPAQVVNAGVSGDTTAGGLARLDWLLKQKPDVLVVGLGGNDGLRGLPVAESEKNLLEIVRRAQSAGANVLLLGMQMPPNYGPQYVADFRAIYPRVAEQTGAPLVPFLLENVGGVAGLNQADGIHPTVAGHKVVAANVLPKLRELVAAREKPNGNGPAR